MFKLLTIWLLSKHCDHLRPHMNLIKDTFNCCQNVQGSLLYNSKNMRLTFILCLFLNSISCWRKEMKNTSQILVHILSYALPPPAPDIWACPRPKMYSLLQHLFCMADFRQTQPFGATYSADLTAFSRHDALPVMTPSFLPEQ